MKIHRLASAAFVVAVGLGGCATVTRGTSTKFNVQTTPPGATVKTSSGFKCSPTPCGMKMPRKEAFDVTITEDGYAPVTQHVRSVVAGGGAAGFVGNAVAGGLVGMAIDGTNGSMNDLSPNPLVLTLAAAPAPPVVAPDAPAVAPTEPAPPAQPTGAPAPASPASPASPSKP